MRASLLALLLLLLTPLTASASVEGNPDQRPSFAFQFGKGWGYQEFLDETTHDVIPGNSTDLDGTRVSMSVRLPMHRSMTGELGYLYDGTKWTYSDLPVHTRGRVHLLSAGFRFYF